MPGQNSAGSSCSPALFHGSKRGRWPHPGFFLQWVSRWDLQVIAVGHRLGIVCFGCRVPQIDENGPGRLAGCIRRLVIKRDLISPRMVELPGGLKANRVRAGLELVPQWRRLGAGQGGKVEQEKTHKGRLANQPNIAEHVVTGAQQCDFPISPCWQAKTP
jgi:hypothetical protein